MRLAVLGGVLAVIVAADLYFWLAHHKEIDVWCAAYAQSRGQFGERAAKTRADYLTGYYVDPSDCPGQ